MARQAARQERISSVKYVPVLLKKGLSCVLNAPIFPARQLNKVQSVMATASIFQEKNNTDRINRVRQLPKYQNCFIEVFL